jgi:hypothetical protein
MSAFNLLIALNFTTPLFCSIYWGSKFGGLVGLLIGLVIGLIMSLGNYFGIKAIGNVCSRWGMRNKEQNRSMYWPTQMIRLLYFVLFLWIAVSSLLVMLITKAVIHL